MTSATNTRAYRHLIPIVFIFATLAILNVTSCSHSLCLSRKSSVASEPSPTNSRPWPYLNNHMEKAYIQNLIGKVDSHPTEILSPAVQRFNDAIESSPRLYMQFTEMFNEINGCSECIADKEEMDRTITKLSDTYPDNDLFADARCENRQATTNRTSGLAAFVDPEVNMLLKGVLNEWGNFSRSPDSRPFVKNGTDGGWLGRNSIADVERVANLPYNTSANFSELFQCDPRDEYYGFDSWDDFFTRRFRPGIRPIAYPEDDNIIVNACESVPHTIAKAKLRDTFFVKGQPYSVLDILGHDPIAYQFSDATVYQAFLSIHSYHRWHAPISGKIHSAYLIDGTYFSIPSYLGFSNEGLSSTEYTGSARFGFAMPYMSEMATRAVIIIEADNPRLGLVAFVAVGMVDISTCEITVNKGQRVKKGDELGLFHLGGSSYCLLFQDGVQLADLPPVGNFDSINIPVLGKIATVLPPGLVVQA